MNIHCMRIKPERWTATLLAAGIAFSGLAHGQDAATDITLICNGTGSVMATQTTFVNTYDRKSKSHEFGTAQTTGREQFSGSGNVEISGNFGRIKLPSALMPPIRSDNGGWFNIQDLFMNDREITGVIRINGLNKPKLRIDRTTGSITLSGGLGDFSGQCDAVDKDAKRRF